MLLQQAKESYAQLSNFRQKRNRCRDYTFGRQWNDLIPVDGKLMSEYEYIIREGNVPLKNNLIRRIVRNILGVFRERLDDVLKEVYSGPLKEVMEANSLKEIYSRSMEEFLISGMIVHRKRLGVLNGVSGVLTEIVSPGSFFFNTDSRDVRGWDLNFLGQIHSVDFNQWCKAFVKSPDDYRKARAIFKDEHLSMNVIEVWRKESRPCFLVHDHIHGILRKVSEEEGKASEFKHMQKKWVLDEVWRYHFITEEGAELCSGDSPYLHGGHPYILKCYPYLEGEIQSLVGDLIDQQRYTNRLITLYDWVIRASAKGVLLLPEGSVDPGNIQSVADQWGRFNGVIMYKARPENPEPRQVSGNMSNLGVSDLLEIQLKMMEDVSGVNGILQGNTSGGNVSGALYNSQTTNALYSLADLIDTFKVFIKDCATLDGILLDQTQIC